MSELKPCPWCGSQPFRMNANEDGGDPYYACPTFLCPGDQKCHNCGEQEGWMAEKWNRRASPPSGVDVEAVIAAFRREWIEGHGSGGVLKGLDPACAMLRRALARAALPKDGADAQGGGA